MVHEGSRPFKCETCGLTFSKKSHLTRHVETVHEKKRPFHCEDCGQSFGLASNLKQHKAAIHGQGEKKIQSKEKNHLYTVCSKAFSRPVFLR